MRVESSTCAVFFLGLLLEPSIGARADEAADLARLDALETLKGEFVQAGIEKLTNANTGASTDLQGLATSLNDLIPDFKLSINGDDVSSDTLNSLGFTYSPRIEKFADIGISVVFNTPEINPAFVEQELITLEQAAALGEGLQIGDSTEVKLTMSRLGSFLGRRYGRSLKDYQDVMNSFLDIATDSYADRKSDNEKLQNDRSVILRNMRSVCPTVRSALTSEFNKDENASKEGLETLVQREIGATLSRGESIDEETCETEARRAIGLHLQIEEALGVYVANLEASLKRMGLFALPELIEQQPQLQLVAGYTDNDELAGPDEFSVAASWEIPLGNRSLNAMIYSDQWRKCEERQADTAKGCIDALSEVLQDTLYSNRPTKSQFRFALSAEYMRRDDYNIAIMNPDLSFMLDNEDAVNVAGSLYWKRYMSDLDDEPYVFEATLAYESNDSELRNDRGLFGLTASRNISNGLALSIGLVWANRAEFRGDVDQELSAKLGLNYKLSAH